MQNVKGSIVLAQVDFYALDIEANANKACEIIENLKSKNVELIAFPEMFLTGYPIGDVLERFSTIADENLKWLNILAQKTFDEIVVIGFVEKDQNNFYNSLAILNHGRIEKIIRKSNLKTNEIYRNFEIIKCNSFQVGIINCECGFNYKDFECGLEFSKIKDFVQSNKPDILLNCSASISKTNKEYFKNKMLADIAKQTNCKLVYLNTVGANESLSFDGISRVYNEAGKTIARAKAFEEQILMVNLEKENEINALPLGMDKLENLPEFDLNYESDLARTYLSVVQAVKGYFYKTGFKKAVLGLSGGLDSTVSAVLLVDALGKENVFGISMPSKITTTDSKSDALKLAQNLGIGFFEIPIKSMFEATSSTLNTVFECVENIWDNRYNQSYTNDNIQARSRATILWGVANEFGDCLPIATSDKSEAYMGYATINGDMSGGFAPLGDITKTKLFALARWLNKNRIQKNVIPQSIIDKRPGAELAINPKTGKPLLAEEALMPYEFLDEIIWCIANSQHSVVDLQRRQFMYERKNSISQQQKNEWINKFFNRMSKSHFKWSIMPTIPIIDNCSLSSVEYIQPIISSKIKY